MVNRKNCLRILAFMLVFGMMGIFNINAQPDASLNGTWISGLENRELRFNNGNYEVFADGILLVRGTYTTNVDILTFRMAFFNAAHPYTPYYFDIPLQPRLYTRVELLNVPGLTEADLRINIDISPKYIISGNTLVLTWFYENHQIIETLTKQ